MASGFMAKINHLQFEMIEAFQNQEGSRVASSWRITGKNNGILGAAADQHSIFLHRYHGWAVQEGGKLLYNLVERIAARSDRSTAGDL
jgi:hypothetical protein